MAGSLDPRGARPRITAGRLEAIWPEASTRLIRLAMSKGADRSTAEDVAQEVAARAMNVGLKFYGLDDFCAWANTVAKNLCVDHVRGQNRLVNLEDVPDICNGHDLHSEVETRLHLDRALLELSRLDPEDRLAIIEGVNGTHHPSRKTAIRSAVRRHRARARLARTLEGLAAIWAFARGSRRFLVAAPATAAVCSILALPAVVQNLQRDNAFPPPHEQTLPPRIGVPAQAERAERAGAEELPASRTGKSASEPGSDVEGMEPAGNTTIAKNPVTDETLADTGPPPPETEPCLVALGEPSHCYVAPEPQVPGIGPPAAT